MNDGRDRLRELLDAVLEEDNHNLDAMAADAYLSPYHFSRQLRRGSGESPMALRRRVLLERAAWALRQGQSVTEAGWAAGFESVEGFCRAYSRAYGHPPSTPASNHWLPAPNGIHFHPPVSLWVQETDDAMDPVTDVMVRHDCDDTAALLQLVHAVDPGVLRERLLPDHWILEFDGPEESIMELLERLVWSKEVWTATFAGRNFPARPDPGDQTVEDLIARHQEIAPAWLAQLEQVDSDGRWNDRLIDALCEPPESFVISTVVAHVITYAVHRRHLVRALLRRSGVAVDVGDPIIWWRTRHGHAGANQEFAPSPTQEGSSR